MRRISIVPAVLFGIAVWLVPGTAHAGGGAIDEKSLVMIVGFLAAVAVAYLLAHFVVDKLQRRFLVVSGIEYVLLGLLLGPAVPQFAVVSDLSGLMPFIALAAGWVGLLRGMEVHLQAWRARSEGTIRIVMLHQLVPMALVGGASYWFFVNSGWVDGPWRESAACAYMLGCCAAADSAEPIDVLVKRYVIEGPLAGRLRDVARIGDVLVIVTFGLVFAIFHPPPGETSGTDLTWAAEWSGLQLLLGVTLGLFFTPFLGGNESSNGRFLAMVGIITFASGAAYLLDLSPLAVNVFLGVVLVNVARTGKLMLKTLEDTEKPMLLVLLVFAGLLWRPPPLALTLYVFAGFLLLRLFAKFLASRMAAWGIPGRRKDLFKGLLAQGEVTVAMAVSFQVVFDGPLVDVVYTVALGSVFLFDLTAPRVLRGLLVDAGDIRRERAREETEAAA